MFINLINWKLFFNLILIVTVVFSAVTIVLMKQLSRNIQSDIWLINKSYIESEKERSKLLLEYGTWTENSKIEALVNKNLNMYLPYKIEMLGP